MPSAPIAKTFTTTLRGEPGTKVCAIVLPFDPREVFGRARVPVCVTLRGHTYRSTIATMHGESYIVVNADARAKAGVQAGDRVRVTLEEDTRPRTIECPAPLEAALRASPPAWERWTEMSYTHQREYAQAVLQAKRPETRERRIAGAVLAIRARPARTRPRGR
ncbi:MAG: DUF1905 domain-containing protein [Phycisphaerales bacterium]|nr:DUF1905 domain-containing protein [Phycisphaerales bacterium]